MRFVASSDSPDIHVSAAAASTRADFEDWVRPHWAAMSQLARRLAGSAEWEDVLQEALTSAWRKRAKFDPSRGTPRSWLLALTIDQARTSWRRRRRVVPIAEPAVAPTDRAQAMDIDAALARLTTRQRCAVELYYLLGLPVAEVASAMSCSEGTVKSTLSDARGHLRIDLGEAHDD
jgi:RNA polymerase sigma-70 factor (ECF subfamily)